MAKFTAGPWRVHNNRIESEAAWLIEPKEYEVGQRLIVVDLHGAMGGEDTNADAQMLAAGPALYAALSDILPIFQSMLGSGLCAHHPVYIKAVEALALIDSGGT